VCRDDVEHMVMIGPDGASVIEAGIPGHDDVADKIDLAMLE
jgi:hypothetical protein